MKCFLMYRDDDFALTKPSTTRELGLIRDLELEILFHNMAAGDAFLREVAESAVLCGLTEPNDVTYRQRVLIDSLDHPEIVREMYSVAVEALERERKVWGWLMSKDPQGVLYRSVEVIQAFLEPLDRLRVLAESNRGLLTSEGFTRFADRIAKELRPETLQSIQHHLKTLSFRHGIVVDAGLGLGNRPDAFVVQEPPGDGGSWLDWLREWFDGLLGSGRETRVYDIDDRDESGSRALSALKGRALASIATVLARSAEHIRLFFLSLRTELGFYLGCVNLRDELTRRQGAFCLPEPIGRNEQVFSAAGMYDICLLLSGCREVISNDVTADAKNLVVITGANRGGKSTFLRSVGLVQIMMQAGMFVPALSLRLSMCRHLFTHFRREEDATLQRGRFDDELSRMSLIIDHMRADDMILLNESFAATNQREGAEIAGGVIKALLDSGVKVFYVTHMVDLARAFQHENAGDTLFLSAQRLADGTRTFRLEEAAPESTSHAVDLYRRVFEPGRIQEKSV